VSKTVVNVEVDERTKREAEAALAPRGVTLSKLLRRVVERIARQPAAFVHFAARSGFDQAIDRMFEGMAFEDQVVTGAFILERMFGEGGDRPGDVRRGLERLVQEAEARQTSISPSIIRALERIAYASEELLTPNTETIAAMQEAERGEFIGEFRTPEELIAYLDAADD
jgi:antitoxin component of RelBE/YafQ-DinJ toxin-antitoxin module